MFEVSKECFCSIESKIKNTVHFRENKKLQKYFIMLKLGLTIQRSLISLMPLLVSKENSRDVVTQSINFLRLVSDEHEALAQNSIN